MASAILISIAVLWIVGFFVIDHYIHRSKPPTLTLDSVSGLRATAACPAKIKAHAWGPLEFSGTAISYYLLSTDVLIRHNANTWKILNGNDRQRFKEREVLRLYQRGKLQAVPVPATETTQTSPGIIHAMVQTITRQVEQDEKDRQAILAKEAAPKVTKKSLLDEDPFGV